MKLKILFLCPFFFPIYVPAANTVLWQRPQQIASRLSKQGHTILYVQGPVYVYRLGLASPLAGGNLFFRKKITDQLTAVQMFFPLTNQRAGKFKFASDSLGVQIFRLYLSSLHFKPDVAIFYFTANNFLLGTLKSMGTKIMYDCIDEVSGFSNVVDVTEALREEKDLVTSSSIVIATSNALRLKLSKLNSNCFYIPNGADFEHFHAALQIKEKPVEIRNIQPPIIGFIGAVYDWINVDLICKLALSHPDYSILIVGPVTHGLGSLKKCPNIIMLGARRYDALPSYLACMDVCLIPFRLNKLTEAANPIKLYEYLAAGKPVVSTELPEIIKNASDLVYIGKNEEDFLRKVEKAVNEAKKAENKEMVAKRIRFAEDNSWEKRVELLETLLKR